MDTLQDSYASAKARFALLHVSNPPSSSQTHPGVQALAEGLKHHGHSCVFVRTVPHTLEGVRSYVLEAVESGLLDALILVGGMGLGRTDVTTDALQLLWHRTFPGFGEFLRYKAMPHMGAKVIFSCAEAGMVARTLVFAVPASEEVCQVAASQVLGPVLGHGIALMHNKV